MISQIDLQFHPNVVDMIDLRALRLRAMDLEWNKRRWLFRLFAFSSHGFFGRHWLEIPVVGWGWDRLEWLETPGCNNFQSTCQRRIKLDQDVRFRVESLQKFAKLSRFQYDWNETSMDEQGTVVGKKADTAKLVRFVLENQSSHGFTKDRPIVDLAFPLDARLRDGNQRQSMITQSVLHMFKLGCCLFGEFLSNFKRITEKTHVTRCIRHC